MPKSVAKAKDRYKSKNDEGEASEMDLVVDLQSIRNIDRFNKENYSVEKS